MVGITTTVLKFLVKSGNMGTHFWTSVAKIFIWQGFWAILVHLYGGSPVLCFDLPDGQVNSLRAFCDAFESVIA